MTERILLSTPFLILFFAYVRLWLKDAWSDYSYGRQLQRTSQWRYRRW